MTDSSIPQPSAGLTPVSKRDSATEQLQKGSCSPEEAWEDWMEWNPSKDPVAEEQLVSPATTSGEESREQNGADSQAQSIIDGSGHSNIPTKKRKAFEIDDDVSPRSKGQSGRPNAVQNRSHSLVEKRYRSNINDKIAELRESVPSLRDSLLSPAESRGPAAALKHNKATILTKAIEYIHVLERRNAYLEDANNDLRSRALRVAKSDRGDKICPGEETSELCSNAFIKPPALFQASTTATDEPRGIIPVPEDVRRLREVVPPQPHYADQFSFNESEECPSSPKVSIRGGRFTGRLIVGSLAGLMIMDSFVGSRNAESRERGLFSLPMPSLLPTLRRSWTPFHARLGNVPHSQILVPLTRGFLIIAILGTVLFLYLFNSKPKFSKINGIPSERNSRNSTSPIEMRQKAWLTAIQTVWVPRHTMLPELLALVLETHAYMTRQILGWHSYSWLTGRNEEDEVARVRAWEIAIDAQLTGGDAEMSRSRLVLTLWASGTLPNTPARLMLKALHIRILFCQASRYLWICEALDSAARRLARKQWQSGEELINNPTVSKDPSGNDPLPDHLVALLQQPIDEIMTDSAIRYAYNLAWNGALLEDHSTEDTAMLGSLDSLAMWSSNWKLQQALHAFLEASETHDSYQSEIEIALRIAPPGSISYFRALAAAAIVSEGDRAMSIAQLSTALLPSDTFPLQSSLVATSSPSNTLREDVSVAIDCASAMHTVASSDNKPDALCEALRISSHALSKIESLDLLAFAATYQLSHHLMLVEHRGLAGHVASILNEHISNAIMRLGKSAEHTSLNSLRLQESFRGALKRLVARNSPGRRFSNTSADTGYGSMSDHE